MERDHKFVKMKDHLGWIRKCLFDNYVYDSLAEVIMPCVYEAKRLNAKCDINDRSDVITIKNKEFITNIKIDKIFHDNKLVYHIIEVYHYEGGRIFWG